MPTIRTAGGLLGSGSTVADTFIMIYEVPTSVSACTATLSICNTNNSPVNVSVAITSNAPYAFTPGDYVFYNMPVEPSGIAGMACGALSPGEKVYVKANLVGVGAQLRGFTTSST